MSGTCRSSMTKSFCPNVPADYQNPTHSHIDVSHYPNLDSIAFLHPAGDIWEDLSSTGAETTTRVGDGCLGIEPVINQIE
jgi:hypothetical protein